jgi:flagellar protein FlbT
MRQGDMMIVNGAPIRFRNRARIELAAKARFLFGKQIMTLEEANTPAKRIYFALQTAYIGTPEEREVGLSSAKILIEQFQNATTSQMAKDMLDQAVISAERDECYDSLKIARRIMKHEDAVLNPAQPTENPE